MAQQEAPKHTAALYASMHGWMPMFNTLTARFCGMHAYLHVVKLLLFTLCCELVIILQHLLAGPLKL